MMEQLQLLCFSFHFDWDYHHDKLLGLNRFYYHCKFIHGAAATEDSQSPQAGSSIRGHGFNQMKGFNSQHAEVSKYLFSGTSSAWSAAIDGQDFKTPLNTNLIN